jgi:transposase
MRHYIGLDVAVKETAVCVMDENGVICREGKVVTHPDDLIAFLRSGNWNIVRIGLEAGPLSQWLHEALTAAGLPAVCIETRHAKAHLKAQVNKSDRNDARGIAQMMRGNLFKPVHVKSLESQKHRALLSARRLVLEKAIAVENDMRGLLRNFGLKVGAIGKAGFEARILELIEDAPDMAVFIHSLLTVRRTLREEFARLHKKVLAIARRDPVCRRPMTIPGIGAVSALAYVSTIDVPERFANSRAVGPSLGLTPRLNQTGESRRMGRITKCGDAMTRALLYEAAQVMLTRVKKWSWLKTWAMGVAKRSGMKAACVALARRLSVIMHRMWRDGTDFIWSKGMHPGLNHA